jgi:hypothetical protein
MGGVTAMFHKGAAENLATARTRTRPQTLVQTVRCGMNPSSAYTRPVFREGCAATLSRGMVGEGGREGGRGL